MEPFPVWKQDRPRTPHKLLNDLVKLLADFYGEHLRRDREDGRLHPPDAWDLLGGFLTTAMQTYAGICIPLADKRPKPLMLQAGVLNRALFEILATVFGILEDPAPRTRMLLRESHNAQAEQTNTCGPAGAQTRIGVNISASTKKAHDDCRDARRRVG